MKMDALHAGRKIVELKEKEKKKIKKEKEEGGSIRRRGEKIGIQMEKVSERASGTRERRK